MKNKIEILLATYNGEKYLQEQIESIFSQSYDNWKLTICDDGSTDNTMEIVSYFIEKFPERIKHLNKTNNHKGAKHTFFNLIEKSTSDYLFFCDQDDVWDSKKIENIMEYVEQNKIQNTPFMIHTDLKVVNQDLELIAPSLISYQRLAIPKNVNDILLRNCVTGCSAMISKELIKGTVQDEAALMHDWWYAVHAKQLDSLHFLPKPLVLYRQHEANVVGAKKASFAEIFNKIANLRLYFKNLYLQNMQYR